MKKFTTLFCALFLTTGIAQIRTYKPAKVEIYKSQKTTFENVLKKFIVNNNNQTVLEIGNNASNSKSEVVKQAPKTTKSNGKNCTTSVIDFNVATADFGYFIDNGTPEFIKPGVVISYEDVLSGSNKINTTPRNPLTIYLERTSAASNANDLSEIITNPQQISNINNALGKMNAKISNNVPANMSIEVSEISSEEQLQYGVSGSYNNKAAGIGAKFNISSSDFKSSYYYMIKFTQGMYKIAVDDATFSFTNANVLNTNKLVYVSEVQYGRKGFLLIKTKKSKSEIEASLGVKLSVGIHNGNVDAFLNKVKEDKESQINMFFYGGNASAAATSLQNIDVKNGFNNWVASKAGEGLRALPISYKLKNMNGDQLVLKSIFTVNQQTCVPVKEYKLQIELEQVKNYKSNDSDKKDDYVFEFEPILIIDNVSYKLQNINNNYKQSIVAVGTNHLFVRDRNNPANQLHVQEGNTQSIKNSGVFIIPEDANLKNAKLQIKFRVHENTNNSLDRIVGISKIQDFNIHEHNLLRIIEVLSGASDLTTSKTFTKCTKNCKGTSFGNYGGETKYFLSGDTVPVEYGDGKSLLRAGEYMLNETKTRSFGMNYTFKLLDN